MSFLKRFRMAHPLLQPPRPRVSLTVEEFKKRARSLKWEEPIIAWTLRDGPLQTPFPCGDAIVQLVPSKPKPGK